MYIHIAFRCIYIYIERERDTQSVIYIYIYIHTLLKVIIQIITNVIITHMYQHDVLSLSLLVVVVVVVVVVFHTCTRLLCAPPPGA